MNFRISHCPRTDPSGLYLSTAPLLPVMAPPSNLVFYGYSVLSADIVAPQPLHLRNFFLCPLWNILGIYKRTIMSPVKNSALEPKREYNG